MKEDKLFVTGCPNCGTEYYYENIESLNPINGFTKGIYNKLGSNIEVWFYLVQCSECKKLFIPMIKRKEEEPTKETDLTITEEVPAVPEVKKERPIVEEEKGNGNKNNN